MSSVFQQLGEADDDRRRKSAKGKKQAKKNSKALPSWTGPALWAEVDEERPWEDDFDFDLSPAEAKVSFGRACAHGAPACLLCGKGGLRSGLRAPRAL